MKRFYTVICALTISLSVCCVAQDQAPATPFVYPVAPDTCTTLESRCNFIIVNFWNNYDISRPITNDADFERAFRDYIGFFKFAHRNIVMSSMRDFLFKARANSKNLSKIGRVAQDALYGVNAEYWSDELYCEIAKKLSESTNLKADERKYYRHQVEIINKNLVGNVVVDFDIATANGKSRFSTIEGETIMLFFTDGSANSSFERTRLSLDIGVNNLMEQGKFKLVQIYVGKPDEKWYEQQPEKWVNVSCEDALDIFDIRSIPSCYILDKDRKILTKNVTVDDVKNALN